MGAARAALRPVPAQGLATARRLWRVVAAVWVVGSVALLPALWVVGGAVGPALGRLPREGAAPGDVLLISFDRARAVAPALLLAVVSGLALVWLFTIVWQAGVVSWELWSGGRRLRLGEVLGLGMVSWWRYARLSAVALVAVGGALWATWWPLAIQMRAAHRDMAEGWMEGLLVGGLALTLLLLLLGMASTLRAAWLLGQPRRRSAAAAWGRGLVDTLRTPLASLGTVVLWVLPGLVATALPLAVGGLAPGVRGGWLLPVLTELAAAVRAFCWVALFASFASASGLFAATAHPGAPEAKDRAAERARA